jgi:hypothetical protein
MVLLTQLVAFGDDLSVRADFPSGSANVESIDQKTRTIRFAPTTHKDRGWVCWWYFKLDGATKGETITLDLGGGNAFALPDQAMVSVDNKTWKHTKPGKRADGRIVYQHPVEAETVWFAWGPPFTLDDASQLLEECKKKSKHATIFELAKSKDGRGVSALRIEEPGVEKNRLGIWIQARQHAWESGGSWVGKGLIEWLLSDDAAARDLRQKATIIFVPIMDVDNVERGAGGKNQVPHDHNRDWIETPVHPEVVAAQKLIAQMHAAGRFDLFIDLHNPGPSDRQPFFFVAPPDLLSAKGRQNVDAFLVAAQKEITGPLKLAPTPRLSGPNYDKNWKAISKNWVTELTKNHAVAVTLETSWNTPHSTQDGYLRVGKELGLAIERYFREPTR